MEHEKQRLRGQLELMEDEYEQRILELQTDIDTLKAKLNDSGDSDSRLRERSNLVAQLVSHVCVLFIVIPRSCLFRYSCEFEEHGLIN